MAETDTPHRKSLRSKGSSGGQNPLAALGALGPKVSVTGDSEEGGTQAQKPASAAGGLMAKLMGGGGDKKGDGLNKITQAFRRTVLVKDLRIYKEREK